MMTSRKLSVEEERESWAQLFAVVIRYEEEMAGNWLRQKTGHLNGATRFRNHRCTNRIAWQVTGITSKAAISDSVMFDPNQFINLGHWIFRSISGSSKFAMDSSCESVTLSKRLFEARL